MPATGHGGPLNTPPNTPVVSSIAPGGGQMVGGHGAGGNTEERFGIGAGFGVGTGPFAADLYFPHSIMDISRVSSVPPSRRLATISPPSVGRQRNANG